MKLPGNIILLDQVDIETLLNFIICHAPRVLSQNPPPIKFGRAPMFSTQNLGQTFMWVTTNFQIGKIQPKRKILLFLLLLFMTYTFS